MNLKTPSLFNLLFWTAMIIYAPGAYCSSEPESHLQLTNKRLEKIAFCEGHIQLAANICWEEKQYDPIGMHNTVTSETKQQSDDLKIEIFIDSTRYFSGKAINLFIKITNKTLQKLKYFGTGNFNLKSLETNMAIKDVNGNHKGTAIEIESGATHYYSYSLLPFYAHKGEDTIVYKPHYVGLEWYSFSVSINIAGGIKVNSNSINFEIIPLPEEYKMYYDLLDSSQFFRQKKINNYEKYNDSFFGYEFYTELLTSLYLNRNYSEETPEEKEKADDFVIKYLTKYPNSGHTSRLVRVLVQKVENDPIWFAENKQRLLNDSTWTSILLRDRLERRKK